MELWKDVWKEIGNENQSNQTTAEILKE